MITIPKVKYNVENVDSSTDVVKAGVYPAHISDITYGQSKNGHDMFTVELTIDGANYNGRKLWHYILPEVAEFRMREFTDALGLPAKGEVDTDKIKGKKVQVRTIIQKSEEYGDQARVKNLLPSEDGGSSADGEEAPYSEWEASELADEIEARELTISGRKTKAKMIAALEADDAEAEDGEESDDEEEDDEEDEILTRADLAGMSRAELKKLISDEELGVKVLKKDSDDTIRDKIADSLELDAAEAEAEEDEEEEEEEEEEGEETETAATASDDEEEADYEEWDMADLKTELKERGLKPDGRKATLVARLKKDDQSGGDPF